MVRRIFADGNSTTLTDPMVAEVMRRTLADTYGNPSSGHAFGIEAESVIEEARGHVAALVKCHPEEVFFTSGATEANNWILSQGPEITGDCLVTTEVEHPSVLEPARHLAAQGRRVMFMVVGEGGDIRLPAVESLPAERPGLPRGLVSVMAGHNEIHFVTDLKHLGQWCRGHGFLLHSDATQAAGRVPLDFHGAGLTAMSLSAHKFHGPKGIGALILTAGVQKCAVPLMRGGGQQLGLRSGTLPTHLIAGFGEACRLALRSLQVEAERLCGLADLFLHTLTQEGVAFRLVGPQALECRLPGCLALILPDLETGRLCEDMPEVAVSTSSACRSSKGGSPIFKGDEAAGRHFVRFGFGRFSSSEDVLDIVRRLTELTRLGHGT